MKITLIRYHDVGDINTRLPQSLNRIRGVVPPLGLAYIAASLEKEGHKVGILDAQASGYLKEDIKERLLEFKPDMVGITTMTSNFRGALEAARIVKSCGIMTVLGGANLEIFPEETLAYDCVDFGIVGEAEIAFVKLIEAIENKKTIENISGIVYKQDGKIKVNPPAIIEDIDGLPIPARHLLPIKQYSSLISEDPMTTMITSRGCPYQCSFCFKVVGDRKIRFRSPIKVVDEMELLVKEYGIKEIMFYDDNIVTNPAHIEGICNEIIRRNLKVRWESPSRVDKVSFDLLKLMRSAGCIRLRFGVESGDEEILEAMNKKINRDMVIQAFKMTHSLGIETFAYFMTGYLKETRSAFENTMSLIKEIKADRIMVTLATPYPKTTLESQAVKAKKMPEDYWRNFILGKIDIPLLPLVKEAEAWIKEIYRSFYLNPGYIFRRLKHIKSYSQFKKHVLVAIGLVRFKLR